MKTVHITSKPAWFEPGHPALCGTFVSFSGDREVSASDYSRTINLPSSSRWCTDCKERFPLWHLTQIDL